MATVLEIIQGIHQAAANGYDGALEEDGTRKQTGLRRDEEVDIRDRRVLDGFKVKLHSGNKLCVMYTTEVLLRDMGQKDKYEDELLQNVSDIVTFLKKEYKKVTGSALGLKEIKETPPEFEVMQTSLIRTEVKVKVDYEVGGLEEFQAKDDLRDKRMKDMQKFIELKSEKRPDNDSRKPEKKD